MEREVKGSILPEPLERLRQVGSGIINIVFNNQDYIDKIVREELERKGYEDGIVIDLRERTENFDHRREIEESKHRHPSQLGL